MNTRLKLFAAILSVACFYLPSSAHAALLWYPDADRDGAGDASSIGSVLKSKGAVLNHRDCNDRNNTINPRATEFWYDGIDQNCDGLNDYDQDQDGYYETSYTVTTGTYTITGTDCDDTNKFIYYSGQIYNYTLGVSGYTSIQAAIDAAADGDQIAVCDVEDNAGVTIYGRNNITIEGLGNSGIADLNTYYGPKRSCIMIQDSTNITISGLFLRMCLPNGSALIPDGSAANVNGGGMYIDNSTVYLNQDSIATNGGQDGSGMYIINSTVEVDNTGIENNATSNLTSGAVYVTGASTVNFADTTATARLGRIDWNVDYGIYIDDSVSPGSTVTLSNITVSDNTLGDIIFASGNTYNYTQQSALYACDSATKICS